MFISWKAIFLSQSMDQGWKTAEFTKYLSKSSISTECLLKNRESSKAFCLFHRKFKNRQLLCWILVQSAVYAVLLYSVFVDRRLTWKYVQHCFRNCLILFFKNAPNFILHESMGGGVGNPSLPALVFRKINSFFGIRHDPSWLWKKKEAFSKPDLKSQEEFRYIVLSQRFYDGFVK